MKNGTLVQYVPRVPKVFPRSSSIGAQIAMQTQSIREISSYTGLI
jgi:hypothetical protein